MITETVYLGRNNAIDLQLTADGVAANLTSVTRMVLCDTGQSWVVDSAVAPAAFDWATAGATGKVSLILGGQVILAKTYTCRLVVYDPTNPDGLVWDVLKLVVVDASCGTGA